MRYLLIPLFVSMAVIVPIVAMNFPLILAVVCLHKRLSLGKRRVLLAIGLGLAATYRMWNLWFLDLPAGVRPPFDYVLTAIVPCAVAFAVVGWFLAAFLAPRRTLHHLA